MLVNYEYPGKILQYEMRLWSRPKLFELTEGAAIYGENGWMLVTNNAWKAYDAAGKLVKQGDERRRPRPSRPTSATSSTPSAAATASRSTRRSTRATSARAMCHAGNISWRTGKKLRFDPATETFDDAEANQYVGREHRKGFELPKIG